MSTDNETPDGDEYDPDEAAREAEDAIAAAQVGQPTTRTHDHYVYVASQNAFLDLGTQKLLTPNAVNARITVWREVVEPNGNVRRIPPANDIKNDPAKCVDDMTWYPSDETIIRGIAITDSGEVVRNPDVQLINTYRARLPHNGDASDVEPWLDLGRRLIPDADVFRRVLQCMAFKFRYPERKVNCGVIIGGNHGTGKDTWIDTFMHCMGRGNTQTIDPDEVFENFNPWAKCVVLKINEMEPQEHKAFTLIKKLKPLCAAPPEAIFINDKNTKRYGIPNVVFVVAMTNDLNSIFMELDPRRWIVIDTYHLPSVWFREVDPEYFKRFYAWRDAGGWRNVAAYLETFDLTGFNAADPVIETAALKHIQALANDAPDDAFSDALDRLDNPEIMLSREMLEKVADSDSNRKDIETLLKSQRNTERRAKKNGYRVYKKELPEGSKAVKRWRWKVGQADVWASYAFVRDDVPEAEAVARIEAHGKAYAARVAGRAAMPDTGGNNVRPFPGKF